MRFIFAFLSAFLLFLNLSFALPAPQPKYAHDYVKTDQELRTRGYWKKNFDKEMEFLKEAYERPSLLSRYFTNQKKEITFMQTYLVDPGSGYGFATYEEAETSLLALIEKYENPKNKTDDNKRELILGDAYHWLGHLYEEKANFLEAYEAFVRSSVHYNKTSLTRSPRINPRIIVQEHADYHLVEIVEKILEVTRTVRREDKATGYSVAKKRTACGSLF